jgi:hypothetical protein
MVITLAVLYHLSGVHDVAYISTQLKDLEIASAPPQVDVNKVSENATLYEKASAKVQNSIRMLKGFRKMFDENGEIWNPEQGVEPTKVPEA